MQQNLKIHSTGPYQGRYEQIPINILRLHNPFPFWHYNSPVVSKEIHTLTEHITDSSIKHSIASEIINTRWNNSLRMYTDGSVNPNLNTTGCSFFIPQFKYAKHLRLNNEICIFTAELFAILLALEWIEQVKPMYSCILSDCLSALQAISEPTPENKLICDIRHILLSIRNQANMFIFEWVPGHCN